MNDVASFRALHAQTRVLVLPNAWDAASAMLFVSAGAAAIATTSAGLAWSCGFADGDVLPREALLGAVAAICRACPGVPVSADVEAGYSDDPAEVARLVSELAALGVSGINLEDGDGPPERLVAKIEAVKQAADVFVNARTDVYLRELARGDDAAVQTVDRARRYAQAGADGIFVPDLDAEAMPAVAAATSLPLAILAVPGLPTLVELYRLGVRRVSAGSGLASLAFGEARVAARAFLLGETDALFAGRTVGYAEMNALAARHQSGSGRV
ncbi:MAG: isocitrate lyase/phosphoenolpyruvate mutase family protein [Vulcanimicrobiaceae bacterium]